MPLDYEVTKEIMQLQITRGTCIQPLCVKQLGRGFNFTEYIRTLCAKINSTETCACTFADGL
jgi:hypothetical protein